MSSSALSNPATQVSFGIDHPADVRGKRVAAADRSALELDTPAGGGTVELAVPGEHNARNALAAAAAAVALGAAMESIVAGLSGYRGVKGRLQRKSGRAGATVIDDTYNANPDSVKAAIAVLAAAPGTRILVLGDMGELGPTAPELHAEVGAHARASGIDALYALGPLSLHAAQAFGAGARHCARCEDVVAALTPLLGPQVTVLVKGSRYMQMERVVAALLVESAAASEGGDQRCSF